MKHAPVVFAVFLSAAVALGGCSSDPDAPGGGAGGSSGTAGNGNGGNKAGAGGATSSGGAGGSAGGSGGSSSGGAGGAARGGSGGSASDAAAAADGVANDTGSGEASGDTAPPPPDQAPPDFAPIAACSRPSVDHLEVWTAHAGSLRPAVGGNLLVKEGDAHHMKVDFLPGAQWHEIVVPLVNSLARKVDLSASRGFTITYSATADLWVQLRPLSRAHGGDQHTAPLPATGGMFKELFVPFDAVTFGLKLLGAPPFPFTQAVKDANFFNFIGRPAVANTFVVKSLRIDGHVPPCS